MERSVYERMKNNRTKLKCLLRNGNLGGRTQSQTSTGQHREMV